ncbi:transmembrane GTPase Fzo1 [Coccidioides immitis RS]|uniref:Transmembrane GTPase Fzo1 n=2 Tax=Coccidioides immitis TaxID=5501 RepID=A0A0E1RV73_COCIM|nr:transmembrane GTPase Fzo1 [Coccidioides immitis RS]EAS28167.1 transmembrane GTPase Fzo1 [Coccidioides immitis RS]KMP08993.1 fusion GTPase protein [Coccidioides immitis RMSCC 2394]
MSQEYFPGDSAGEGSSRQNARRSPPAVPHHAPDYMVVGSGSTSESAASLIASLDRDSGYGSAVGGTVDESNTAWHAGLMEDRPTPTHTPILPGHSSLAAQHERLVLANHVHQLQYNANRTQLGRYITRALDLLKELQEMNRQWPAHYPSVSSNQVPPNRPNFTSVRSYNENSELLSESSSSRPDPLRRAATSITSVSDAESSHAAERRPQQEPRLFTQQIAREFSILKLDLKLGTLSQAELVHSLEKNSIASLLDGKVSQSIKHLLSLRDRIDDTSSKVLVTGDLNAGKSTFCNALLRRKILPEDQQPCTSIFCEVVDARENSGIEEVHAIHKDTQYNRNDESTYDVYSLADLENLVVDNTKYMQCKVYVKDTRSIDESLLNNGVVDIALIDAPGLNSDSVKTTAVFARQEEIDVVVFVVSAANHFTLSAREFITNAAHEKAYIFIVVNGFDNIRDRTRCQRMILGQVQKLSPRTFKESAELVHFVSSNAVPVAAAGSGFGGDGDGGDGGDGGDDDGDSTGKARAVDTDDDDKGKGKEKEKEKIQDFENLEGALRRFVLEKRSRSKLAPARTYLLNIFNDLYTLASVNRDVAASELDRMSKELDELVPAYEEANKRRTEIGEQLDKSIDDACDDVYNHTRSTLSSTISKVAESDLGVEYPGLLAVFQYAEDVKSAMLEQISACVSRCEDYARTKSVQGVNMIHSLGLLHVGEDKFPNLAFRSEVMFRQQRHSLARQADTEIELWDFVDLSGLWERQEKVAGTGMAMTVVGILGSRALGSFGWMDGIFGAVRILGPNNVRKMIIPSVLGAAILTAAYIVSQIPRSLPSRLSRKISTTLAEIDYVHSNAVRISTEVGRVLRMPATRLQTALQVAAEDLAKRKAEVGKVKHESEVARKYFANLFRESNDNRRAVEAIDLEATIPGA